MYPDALFSIGSLNVYAYGLCMAVGIIACFVFLLLTFQAKNFDDESTDKMLLIGIISTGLGVLFAMLFQALYDYIDNPSSGFELGGMTFLGGLIGGVVCYILIYSLYVYVIAPRVKNKRLKWLQNNMNASITDALPFVPVSITIAHAFGRLGCTFAGCCYGQKADWGIYFRSAGATVIPTQLFECIFLVILAVVMAVLYFKFKFNYNFSVYCISYGVWRFIIEFFRNDSRGSFIPGITPSQFWCIIMVLAGIGYIFLYRYVLKNLMKHPENQPPANSYTEKRAKKISAASKRSTMDMLFPKDENESVNGEENIDSRFDGDDGKN